MAPTPELTPASAIEDSDPQETREWHDALAGVIEKEGTERAHFLIEGLIAQARGDIQAAKEMTVFAKRLRKQDENND